MAVDMNKANAGGTIYDTGRLGVGGVSHERGKKKVPPIDENLEWVFEIAGREKIPTYQTADRLAERESNESEKSKNKWMT